MGKFRFNLALILFIFLIPTISGEINITLEAREISYGAPGHAFVDSGMNITFNITGIENAESVLWDFGRDISGPKIKFEAPK